MTAHSPIGASGASRYLACAGSVALLGELAATLGDAYEGEPEEWTQEGTQAHGFIERCLALDMAPEALGCPPAMATPVKLALGEMRGWIPEAVRWGSETKIELPELDPEAFGTVDFWALVPNEEGPGCRLVDIDYKHGQGVAVEALGNPQIRYYALGLISTLARQAGLSPKAWVESVNLREIELVIVQPRSPGRKHSADFLTPDELFGWFADTLYPGVQLVREAERQQQAMRAAEWVAKYLRPGPKQCQFCKALPACPAAGAAAQKVISVMGAGDHKAVTRLSDDDLAAILKLAPVIRKFIRQGEEFLVRRMKAGHKDKHFKLVQGRGTRMWKQDAGAVLAAIYGPDIWTKPELLSPAQVEETLPGGVDIAAMWSYKEPGPLSIAPLDDSKAAVPPPPSPFAGLHKG